MNKRIKSFLENFILLCIILVLIQTFLSEYAIFMNWQGVRLKFILIAGLIFDFIFTIEFFTRYISAKGKRKKYLFYERGWIDFLSSLPLLLLNSAPSVYLLYAGSNESLVLSISVLNILKVIKALRVTRILRLIRVMKIFGKIHNTGSVMAQHHISQISTITTMGVIVVAMIMSVFNINPYGSLVKERAETYENILKLTEMQDEITREMIFEKDKYLVELYDGPILLYSNPENYTNYMINQEINDNFIDISYNSIIGTVYIGDIVNKSALLNLVFFGIIILQILFILIFYSSHFVQKITDPIFIMNKGFKKKDYNLQVKIPDWYKDHEIYETAKFYNDKYLPAKAVKLNERKSSISLDDLDNFKL